LLLHYLVFLYVTCNSSLFRILQPFGSLLDAANIFFISENTVTLFCNVQTLISLYYKLRHSIKLT
jgi:hypothetical protein